MAGGEGIVFFNSTTVRAGRRRFGAWVLVLALVVTLVPHVRSSSLASEHLPPIVFISERDGNRELYLGDPADASATRITSTSFEDEITPAWSPDGSRIAYGGDTHLFISDPDGANRIGPLATTVDRASQPSWSPDGSQLAIQVSENFAGGDDWEVYVIDNDGSNLTQLTTNTAQDRYPHWSPDGTRVAIARDDILTIIDATTGADVASFPTAGTARYPRWSPDGSRIVYSRPASGWAVAVLDVGAGTTTTVLNDGAFNWHPTWSPDGTQILFASTTTFPSDFDLVVINSDGTGRSVLPFNSTSSDFYPDWRPGTADPPSADLDVTVSVDSDVVAIGRPATYRARVSNSGPDPATAVTAAVTVVPDTADVTPLDGLCTA
ncbi:MAG: hypothetical protein ACR2OI_06985, partial [Acidimicrobiia bacterium]